MAGKKKHKFHTTHVEHHKDGSHTVHHMHEDGAHADVKHAVSGLDSLHDSMEDHLGSPNAQEGEAMPQAAPAPAPAGPTPGGMPGMGA
jgi:hypothetical protein